MPPLAVVYALYRFESTVLIEVRTLPTATNKGRASNPKVELYETLIATIPNLERKGDANPYTAVNGNMFTLLHQSEQAGHSAS